MADLSPSGAPAPLRVFVVENHPDTLHYLRMYLEMTGHVVQSAATMGEALTVVPDADPDVLISDIGLPDGSGWELLRRLGPSSRRPLYAIAMSGFGTGADEVRSREAGYRHHLTKPFLPEALDVMLAEAAQELHVVPHP